MTSPSQKALNALADYSSDAVAPNSMDIRTEYLEPITSNPLKYTFRLDQAGYLDTNSLIVFKLQATGNNDLFRVNCFNGVLGGIKRAIFQVGDHIINDIQDLNKYATIKQMLVGNRSLSNQYTGHYTGSQLWTKTQRTGGEETLEHATAKETYANLQRGMVGSIVKDDDRSGIQFGKYDDGSNAHINSQPISTNKNTNNQYGVTLGTLFPALQGQKIPLFLFDKQRILITIEFHGASHYVNSIVAGKLNYDAGQSAQADNTDITIEDCRMVVDYIIMPTEAQNKIIAQTQQQGGYKLNFYDVVNVEKNIPSVTGSASGVQQEVEHRIGQNNREVHNIYMWKSPPATALNSAGGDGAGNNQVARALRLNQFCKGYNEEEYNCEVNGRDEHDHFVFNPCSQYNELAEALGSDPNLDRPEYIADENTTGSLVCPVETGLMGTMKPLALSLTNGEAGVIGAGRQIGSYPIVWKWRRKCNNAIVGNSYRNDETIKCNYFIECSRTASIMNTPKGMNVIVSY